MYHRRVIERFLEDERATPLEVSEVDRRIDKVCDSRGFFSADRLDHVMGEAKLAQKYRAAYERSHRYR